MTNTTYYNLNIVEGTDIVNPLTVDNPNYEKIDETMHNNAVAGVTLATEITNATVHAITRENSDCAVIRFIATSQWKAGDSVTVDGVQVTPLLPSGETLPDGAYVINANVLCILTGTNLTIYAERKKADNANEIAFNGTTVGAELNEINGSIGVINTAISEINTELNNISGDFITKVELNNIAISSSGVVNVKSYIPSGKSAFAFIITNSPDTYSPYIWYNTQNGDVNLTCRGWYDWKIVTSVTISGILLCI